MMWIFGLFFDYQDGCHVEKKIDAAIGFMSLII